MVTEGNVYLLDDIEGPISEQDHHSEEILDVDAARSATATGSRLTTRSEKLLTR
jgi:hypothetical protein